MLTSLRTRHHGTTSLLTRNDAAAVWSGVGSGRDTARHREIVWSTVGFTFVHCRHPACWKHANLVSLLFARRPSPETVSSKNWNQANTGFTIAREEQVAYNIWFAELVSAEKGSYT